MKGSKGPNPDPINPRAPWGQNLVSENSPRREGVICTVVGDGLWKESPAAGRATAPPTTLTRSSSDRRVRETDEMFFVLGEKESPNGGIQLERGKTEESGERKGAGRVDLQSGANLLAC